MSYTNSSLYIGDLPSSLVKSFEISKLSNQTRVRDERIKEQMYDFHDHLDRIHNTLF